MHSLTIRAVIFDMDGVITDTMPYHMAAWRQIFINAGIKLTKEDIYKREGQKGIDSLKEIFNDHGKKFDPSKASSLLKDKEELFKKIFKRKFIKGSRPFISALSKRGFKLALVTGTSRHEAQHLLPTPIWNAFDATVCGCDVQNGKPHPEPYLKAIKLLNINTHEACVLENAPFGIRSAKAAGLTCIAIETSLPKKYLSEADCVVKSYEQLLTKIKFIKYEKS